MDILDQIYRKIVTLSLSVAGIRDLSFVIQSFSVTVLGLSKLKDDCLVILKEVEMVFVGIPSGN